MILILTNATLLDTDSMTLVGERHLTIEDDRIVEVSDSPPTTAAETAIDARGRFVLPGFIDAHIHHVITTMDFARGARLSEIERALAMGALAEATVQRGFTTVRDTGGATSGLVKAIESGLCAGPRIVRAGRALS